MRILIVHNFYQDPGGEDVVFEQEMAALAEIPGYELSTLTFRNLRGLKGFWQFFWSPWNIFAASRLRKSIKQFRPDIIHFHNTQYACGPLLIRTAKRVGVPIVMSLHNFRLLCPSATLFLRGHLFTDSIQARFPWRAIWYRALDHSFFKTAWTALSYWGHRALGTWNMVDRYFVLAEFSKHLIGTSSLKLPSSQVIVKPNFVDVSFAAEPQQKRESHYLYVGRLSAEKGILELMHACADSPYTLHIAGSGPLQPAVEQLVAKHPQFHYLGPVTKEKVFQEMQRCRALIVPSVCYEGGAPLTIIEAMMLHTPVLASRIGAIADVIRDGQTGYTFDPTYPESICSAIKNYEHLAPAERLDMLHRAAERANSHYSKSVVIKVLQQQYDQVCQANN